MAHQHVGSARELQVHSADGTLLHAEVRGPEDGPTVVLVHCWSHSLASWGPVVRELDPHLRVVLYDVRGHGRSQTPLKKAGYGPDKLADDLCAVLDAAVPVGQKAVVAGHSMGGMAILASGARESFQNKVSAVLLSNTASKDLVPGAKVPALPQWITALGMKVFLMAPLPLGPRNAGTTAALKYFIMGENTDPRMVRLCMRMVHKCAHVPRSRWGKVMSTLDQQDAAARITVPTTVVGGTADKLTPRWQAHHLANLIPGAGDPLEICGIGHIGPLEMPEVLARQVEKLVHS